MADCDGWGLAKHVCVEEWWRGWGEALASSLFESPAYGALCLYILNHFQG